MRLLRLLNLRRLRRQPVRAIVAMLSVAAGVSLVISVVVLQTSFDRSMTDFARSLAGPAPLRVIGPLSRGGLDQAVLADVEATDGVRAAVPVVQAVTLAEGAAAGDDGIPVLAFGVDCRVEQLFGPMGCDDATLAGRAGAAPFTTSALLRQAGAGAVLRTDVGRVPLAGAPTLEPLERLNQGRVVVFPLAEAQRLFARPASLDTIYVLPDEGAPIATVQARLQDAVGGWNRVLRGTDPPPGADVMLQGFLPLFTMLSLFALGIGASLIRNTVELSLAERRRDLAVVAALGATPRMIARGALVEAGLIGAAGGAVGTMAGVVAARPLLDSMSVFTERFSGLRLEVHVDPVAVAIGLLLGTVTSVVAAWRTVRRASRLDVSAELVGRDRRAEAAPQPSVVRGLAYTSAALAAIGLGIVAADGGALQPWQPIVGQLAFVFAVLMLIAAVGAFTPPVSHVLLRVVDRPATARLGLANLVREPGRSRVMAVAVAAAVGIAITVAGAGRSVERAITEAVTENTEGGVLLSTLPPSNSLNIDAKLPPEVLARVGELPGVADIERGFVVLVNGGAGRSLGASALDNPSLTGFELLDGTADRDRFADGEVLIGPGLARTRDIRGGDMLRLPGRNGFVDVKVQGVWRDGDFGGMRVAMPVDLLERLWGPQPLDDVFVRAEPGVSSTELAATIRAAALDPDLEVRTSEQFAAEITKEIGIQLAPFWALQRGMLIIAFVTVLFTLLLAAVQRRRELAMLGAIGMRPSELFRMVVFEAVTVGVIGTVLGTAAAIGFSLSLREALSIVLGYHNALRFDLLAPVVWGLAATTVVAVAAAWPAWRTSRVEVLDGLRYE